MSFFVIGAGTAFCFSPKDIAYVGSAVGTAWGHGHLAESSETKSTGTFHPIFFVFLLTTAGPFFPKDSILQTAQAPAWDTLGVECVWLTSYLTSKTLFWFWLCPCSCPNFMPVQACLWFEIEAKPAKQDSKYLYSWFGFRQDNGAAHIFNGEELHLFMLELCVPCFARYEAGQL